MSKMADEKPTDDGRTHYDIAECAPEIVGQMLLAAELRDVNSHLQILLSLPEHERPYLAVRKKIDNLIRHWECANARRY